MLNTQQAVRPLKEQVLSLAVLAERAPDEPERRGEFGVLVRHFLDRFFAGEIASADRDTRTRLVQAACAIGIPPFIVSLYLYPAYHMPRHVLRPYWAQAGDHYFYVLYTLVCMGLVTIFEWDLIFPDALDVVILSPLPTRLARLLWSRIAAIFLLLAGTLFASSFLAPLVLPAATDPPGLFRFLAAHVVAVGAAGIFGAVFLLALEGVLVALLGDRRFRRISLWLQGLLVIALLTMLFLYPVVAGALRGLLGSGSAAVYWMPPLWFLGIYQVVLDGGFAPGIFHALAHIGWLTTFIATGGAVLSYPLAWWRKTRDLVEGTATRQRRNAVSVPVHRGLHATLARSPSSRAIWHFIGQNLVRVPRYRMVLVMYGGMGVALVVAAVTRVTVPHGAIGFRLSGQGLHAMLPIVAFWTVSGLRSTFLAPADERGRWVFRVTSGKAGLPELRAAERWVFLWALALTWAAAAWACCASPAGMHLWKADLSELCVTGALCLLLTDVFFLNVFTIPFTGTRPDAGTNLALLLIPYIGFFPVVVLVTVSAEAWVEKRGAHLAIFAALAAATHFCLAWKRRRGILSHIEQVEPDEDEEEFPLRLGLRY